MLFDGLKSPHFQAQSQQTLHCCKKFEQITPCSTADVITPVASLEQARAITRRMILRRDGVFQ
jgi:hypothetical protein